MTAEEQARARQQEQQYSNMLTREKPQEQTKTQEEQQDEQIEYDYCLYCGRPLAVNEIFCIGCGEKHGGEENTCQFCQTKTTKKICPKCQNVLIPYTCPKCGAKTTNGRCACGDVLDKRAQTAFKVHEQIMKEPPPVIRQMSAEEVKKIEALFKAQEESPNLKKLQKILLDREKLLTERASLKKMREEIIEVFGERPFKIELPDAEEQAARMRLYASLEKSIVQKQRRATQEELEAMYPELAYIHEAENKAIEERETAEEADRQRRAEQAKRFQEMEEKYRAILEDVEKDIQDAKDKMRAADESKKEEERSRLLVQKAEEEAMLRREREAAEKKAREEAAIRAKIAAQERAAAEAKARAEAERRARAEAEHYVQEQQRIAAAHERAAAEEVARIAAKEAARLAAQRERERQEAQEKARRQAYLNRIVGTFYYYGDDGQLTVVFDTPTHGYCNDKFASNKGRNVYSEHAVRMNGNDVTLNETANPSNYNMASRFQGSLNSAGTVLSGYWYKRDGTQTRHYTYNKVN